MRARRILSLFAVAAMALPAIAADTTDTTLYLRSEGESCADRVNSLSYEVGEGETTCNTRVGLPLYEIDQQLALGLDGMDVYDARKSDLGFVLDASQNLTGQITFRHGSTPSDQGLPTQPIPAGGGHYEVDVRLTVNGKVAVQETLTLDDGSMDVVTMELDLDLDDALNGAEVTSMSFAIGVGGVTPNSGWVKLDGATFINVPRA